METDYNAQTILRATADDTPTALTVAEQTLVGRITSGNIEALTATQVRTLLNVEDGAEANKTESFIVAVSDEVTDLTTGTDKVKFRMPYALSVTEVRASVTEAPTGSVITVAIFKGGDPMLSTPISIDAGEKSSLTAATPPVISDGSLTNDIEMSVDITAVGSTTAGKGLKVMIIGNRT